jgi:hypothetical protein
MPTDRPIDGIDQSDVLFGKNASGHVGKKSIIENIAPGGPFKARPLSS